MPHSLQDWADYCYAVVDHYKNHIKYWEIWNEPDHAEVYGIRPQDYVEMLKQAYQAIKRADPQAQVLGIGGCNWPRDYLRRILTETDPNVMDYMDIASLHVTS